MTTTTKRPTISLNDAAAAIHAAIKGTSATVRIDDMTDNSVPVRIEWNNIAVDCDKHEVDKALAAIKVLDDLGSRASTP